MAMGDIVGDLFKEPEEPLDEARLIEKALLKYLGRPTPLKRLKNYHVTEIRDMCCRHALWARMWAKRGAVWKRQIEPMMAVTFDIGHAVHEWVNRNYLPNLSGYTVDCNHEELKLAMEMGDGVTLAGAVDNFIRRDETGETFGIEIKTIKRDSFDKMRVAKIEHRFQVYLYLWMMSEIAKSLKWGGEPWALNDVERFLILYVAKQYPKAQETAIRAFLIDPVNNPKHKEEFEEAIITTRIKLASIRDWVAGGPDLPKAICKDNLSSRGLDCIFRKVCFDGADMNELMEGYRESTQRFIANAENLGEASQWPFLDWTSA